MTKQPEWKFVANLGDVNPLDYGGYFVFEDRTGVYPPEAEKFDPDTMDAHRIVLDPLTLVNGKLINARIAKEEKLPYPLESYTEWFEDSIPSIASYIGMEEAELISLFCSNDPRKLARAYEAVYMYHGWENGDSYPLTLTEEEAEKRYQNYK